jgi:hypothetical protein
VRRCVRRGPRKPKTFACGLPHESRQFRAGVHVGRIVLPTYGHTTGRTSCAHHKEVILKRSHRQLAKIRERQPAPLTPYSVTSDTPATPQAAPTPAPARTAGELAAAREERIEVQVRSNAIIFGLKSQLAFEERERVKERHEHTEQYRRLLSRIEKLEQDALTAHTHLREMFVKMADEHKAELYALVRDGKFCGHAAASHEDLVKEIDFKETSCLKTQN